VCFTTPLPSLPPRGVSEVIARKEIVIYSSTQKQTYQDSDFPQIASPK